MYHIYVTSDGKLISSTSSEPTGLNPIYDYVSLPAGEETGIWNESTLVFDARPVKIEVISAREFLSRLTDDEWESFITFAETNIKAKRFITTMKILGDVEMSTSTQNGLDYLEAQAILAPGRAAEIFNNV